MHFDSYPYIYIFMNMSVCANTMFVCLKVFARLYGSVFVCVCFYHYVYVCATIHWVTAQTLDSRQLHFDVADLSSAADL